MTRLEVGMVFINDRAICPVSQLRFDTDLHSNSFCVSLSPSLSLSLSLSLSFNLGYGIDLSLLHSIWAMYIPNKKRQRISESRPRSPGIT